MSPIRFTSLLIVWVLTFSAAFASTAKFGLSPDNSHELLTATIKSAKKKIVINIYEFSSPTISQTIADQIQKGVTVQMLVEGQPLTPIGSSGKKVLKQIYDSMLKAANPINHLYIMQKTSALVSRRYRYNHAKYVVVDDKRVLVASENFSSTGHPLPGDIGNRGWEIVVDNKVLAKEMTQIFTTDTDMSFKDVIEYQPSPLPIKDPLPAAGSQVDLTRKQYAFPIGSGIISTVKIIASPDSADDLKNMIDLATSHLEVQHMNLPAVWKDSTGTKILSPLVGQMIAAAKKGVTVRVLLNDDHVFDPKPNPTVPGVNDKTADFLNKYAKCKKLPIQARIVNVSNVGITYIHNKGMLADDEWALISSINGSQNSVENNREIAVQVNSQDAAAYYGAAFDSDWNHSAPAKPANPIEDTSPFGNPNCPTPTLMSAFQF